MLDIWPVVALRSSGSGRAYLQRMGFTAREARGLLSQIKPVQVRDSMVQRLCETLVCEPNDLMRWTGAATDALAKLNQPLPTSLPDQLQWIAQQQAEKLLAERMEKMKEATKVGTGIKGTLRLDVGHLLSMRQERLPLRYLQRLGFSKMEAQTLLSDQRMAVRMSLLTRLCQALKCMPNDLYRWDGPEGHVLSPLRRGPVPDAAALMRGVPLSELRRVLG